jgi:ubiquinone/menaquinone biosynthesis C-methylase UbiE
MTKELLKYICEPKSKSELFLQDCVYDSDGNIESGTLISKIGNKYPIINGIPRFINDLSTKTVTSFGDEWNYFNFIDFKINWLEHTVKNTFGSPDYFKDKIIVDAGGGSGAQAMWFLEYGAEHVIIMDLSHSVDDVVKKNLKQFRKKVDIIQCSIDEPPIKNYSINGIVNCHNVIQHTASVENTAKALYDITGISGEFVFNCYPKNTNGIFRKIRYFIIYLPIRNILSRSNFFIIITYSRIMALLREIPFFGILFEKMGFCVSGETPKIDNESILNFRIRRYKSTTLNTFDCFGSHSYQHLKTDSELKKLCTNLQPDLQKIVNFDKYFQRPSLIGCALRIFK